MTPGPLLPAPAPAAPVAAAAVAAVGADVCALSVTVAGTGSGAFRCAKEIGSEPTQMDRQTNAHPNSVTKIKHRGEFSYHQMTECDTPQVANLLRTLDNKI